MKIKIVALAILLAGFSSCKNQSETNTETASSAESKSVYNEPYRPQYHFSPPKKWMNDPNGLVYHDGIYHLFYQYYPDDIVWGPMHWGHATSTDMVHWEHKPIALYPDEHGLIFSGSAVVDKNNTSGLGTKDNPPLVAIFTYHDMESEKAGNLNYQTQGIAYSLDNGDTWTKYEGNPVIGNNGIKDFRDPKVFWDADTKQWVMVLVAGDHAQFYRSPNLKDWEFMSDFGQDIGAHGGVWECPDLFPLEHPDPTHYAQKWVLLISINPGGPNGGSATQYFIGDWDGTTFTPNDNQTRWLEYGTDNYAGVTYNNTIGNERLFIGWMSNWDYARSTPTKVWRSAMTLPRNLKLAKYNDQLVLKNYPYDKVDSLTIYKQQDYRPGPVSSYDVKDRVFNQHRIQFQTTAENEVVMNLKNKQGDNLKFAMSPLLGKLMLDRTSSGKVDFQESFGNNVISQPYAPQDSIVKVSAYLDASSIEIFVDYGRYVFTQQIFPNAPYTHVSITGLSERGLSELKIDTMASVWQK